MQTCIPANSTAGRPPFWRNWREIPSLPEGRFGNQEMNPPFTRRRGGEGELWRFAYLHCSRRREPVAATGMGRKRVWKEGKKTSRRRRRRKVPTFPDFLGEEEVDGAESVNVPSPPFLLSIQIYTGNRKYSCWLLLLPLLLHGATVSSVRPFPFCKGKNCCCCCCCCSEEVQSRALKGLRTEHGRSVSEPLCLHLWGSIPE